MQIEESYIFSKGKLLILGVIFDNRITFEAHKKTFVKKYPKNYMP